jgi:hypothetical protein
VKIRFQEEDKPIRVPRACPKCGEKLVERYDGLVDLHVFGEFEAAFSHSILLDDPGEDKVYPSTFECEDFVEHCVLVALACNNCNAEFWRRTA